jgi:hypothetical protein
LPQQALPMPFLGAQMPSSGGNRCDSNAFYRSWSNFPIEGYTTQE